MKAFKHLLFSLIFISLFAFSGCKKYEDDPASSRLLSVKRRISAHGWNNARVINYKTGQIYSTGISDATYTGFSMNGGCSSRAYFLSECFEYELLNHKNKIRFSYRDGHQAEFTITTLTWNSFDIENDSIKISLKKQIRQ